MKKLLLLMLLPFLLASHQPTQEPKKVHIQSVENEIQIGSLAKNRNLIKKLQQQLWPFLFRLEWLDFIEFI